MMATAVALCPPTPPLAGAEDVITIYAPTWRAATEARAILPLALDVVAAPAWPVARAALAASSCLVVRTPPGSDADVLPLLADVRRAHPRLAVVYQAGDLRARRAAVSARLAHEVVAWDDLRSTLWSRVQGALTAALLEAAAVQTLAAPGLAPRARAWLAGLWSLPIAPHAVPDWCDAGHTALDELALSWPSHCATPDALVTWTLLLHTAVGAARGESWRVAADAAGLDPRALRHALARGANLRAGELGAPVVPALDNAHARLRRAFRRRVLGPMLGG